MGLPQRDALRHTYGDYRHWPEEVRYELVDGIAYLMSPAPSRQHQRLLGELFYQVRGSLEGKPCEAYLAPFDVRLPRGDEADDLIDTVVQPGLLVVCDRDKLDERGMRGAPDWVVEVLSPTTAAHDQTTKLAAYERARVPEVWLVHPLDRVLTVYRLEGDRFSRPSIHELGGRTPVTAVSGLVIDWDLVQAPLGCA
ncbi:MAG: Uma2 family endonuclease [Pseudomonadota bacterium]|nr:Uma2 family endonuclease [Pseudomonadota bacterium]